MYIPDFSCFRMERHLLSVVCLWSSFSITVFFIAVDSMITRSSTQRSAYFQAFEGNLVTTVIQHSQQGYDFKPSLHDQLLSRMVLDSLYTLHTFTNKKLAASE